MLIDPESLPVPDLGFCCRGCRYLLVGLDSHRCPECGRPFTIDEFIPAGGYPQVLCEGKEVLLTPAVIDLLRDYGIPAGAVDDLAAQVYPGFQPSVKRLAVAREYYFDALDLLSLRAHGQPLPPPPSNTVKEEWTCSKCKEVNPGNFEICWSCGTERPPAE